MSAEEYLRARSDFESVSKELGKASTLLQSVADALKHQPGRMIFANSAIGLPIEASMSRDSKSFDAREWPSVDGLMALLDRWHKARANLSNTWARVPSELRSGLLPPTQV